MNTLVLISLGLLVLIATHIQAMPTAEEVLSAVKEENAHKISKRSGSNSSGGRGFRRRGGVQRQFIPRQPIFAPRQPQFAPRRQQIVPQFFPQQQFFPQVPARNSPQIQSSQIVFPLNFGAQLGGQVRRNFGGQGRRNFGGQGRQNFGGVRQNVGGQRSNFRQNNFYQPYGNNFFPQGRQFNNQFPQFQVPQYQVPQYNYNYNQGKQYGHGY